LSIYFEEILSGAHENFEEQNKVLESSIIIINYCIIINVNYNYFKSNEVLLEECDKNENFEVTEAAATTSCLERNL
jgi:hypothetical protein